MADFRFLFQPVDDLEAAVRFYSDVLGFSEVWRDTDTTVGVTLKRDGTQVMLSVSDKLAGPMFLVADLEQWIAEHSDIPMIVERDSAGDGTVAGFRDPAGNLFYVFDQPPA